MEQNNQINIKLNALKNGWNVRKQRKLMLHINYLKGLIVEFQTDFDTFIEKQTVKINTYYQEEVSGYERLLAGETKRDDQRKKNLSKFDEKAYWERRKYKTAQSKNNSENLLSELLKTYDEQAILKRVTFEKELNEKYPHQELTVQEKEVLVNQINKRKHIRDQRLEQLNNRFIKKETFFVKFMKKTKDVIDKKTKLSQVLSATIDAYNHQKIASDKLQLKKLETKCEVLQNVKKLPLKLKEKRVFHLENQINNIKTSHHMIENEKIHLSLSNLKMYFGGVKAVNDLTFDVKKGEIFGLIGPNGAGKTTVFNCLTQFYKATAGSMIFRNKEGNIVDLYQKKTHDMISEGIARSFQNVELIWELTVIDNLLVAAHSLLITNYFEHMIHSRKMQREEKVLRAKGMQILSKLGIEAYAYRSPYGLPYGVLKKIELARTLMTDPTLIILDEPAAGLNDAETMDLASVIKTINQTFGITIFLVEHDMGLVMSICDTVCAISFGKMIGLGTPKEIQNNPEVRKAYLGDDSDE